MKTEDIRFGIKTTASVVTSAAIVIVFVFGIFATLSIVMLKQFGVGLATAILIDATIVRAVVPAAMMLLEDWNWYLPRWLEWLPRLEHERSAEPVRQEARARAAGRLSSNRIRGPRRRSRACGPAPTRGPEWGAPAPARARSEQREAPRGRSRCPAAAGSPRSQSRPACSAIASACRLRNGLRAPRAGRRLLRARLGHGWLGVFLCLPADSGWSVASSFLRPRPGRACSSAMEASLSRRGLRGSVRRPPSRPSGKLKVWTDATSAVTHAGVAQLVRAPAL